MNTLVNPLTFPARPVNGGPLERALAKSGEWLYEPKFNGWRVLIHAPTGTAFNRHGKRLSIESDFKKAIAELAHELKRAAGKRLYRDEHQENRFDPLPELEWVDCEGLERRHNRGRGSLVVIDLPELKLPLKERGMILHQMFCPAIDHCAARETVYSVPQFTDGALTYSQAKLDNKSLGCEFYEGVVAKRADSLYPIQLRSPDTEFPFWMKHRWAF